MIVVRTLEGQWSEAFDQSWRARPEPEKTNQLQFRDEKLSNSLIYQQKFNDKINIFNFSFVYISLLTYERGNDLISNVS